MRRSVLFCTLAAIGIGGCKLQPENSAQNKQFGRAGTQIAEIAGDLTGKINKAVEKFVAMGEVDEISILIKRGGKEGAKAIAAFKKVITAPADKVSDKIADLHRTATLAVQPNKNLERILDPLFDDANDALDELLIFARRYYQAVSKIAGRDFMLHKELAVVIDIEAASWRANLADLAKFEKSAGLSDKINHIKTVIRDALLSSRVPIDEIVSSLQSVFKQNPINYSEVRFLTNKGLRSDRANLREFFAELINNNSRQARGFFRSFTTKNVEDIEKLIYVQIPSAKSFEEMENYLYKLADELEEFKTNIVGRRTLVDNVFSPDHASSLRNHNVNYLSEISRAGRINPDASSSRVFGIWGSDLYKNVAEWGNLTGKLPVKFDADVDVRDLFYNMQSYCRHISC